MQRLILLVPILLTLVACDGGRAPVSGQVIARVNGVEISVHQLNRLLAQRPGATPEQRADMVEALVRRELAVQQAVSQKLERDPEIMLRLEEARRDVLATAWAERIDTGRRAPGQDEAARYFAAHPGLFAERRQYRLQELVVAGTDERLSEAVNAIGRVESVAQARARLKEKGIPFSERAASRLAEQIPIEVADRLVGAQTGHTLVHRLPKSVFVYEVLSAERAPVTWAQAEPAIRAHLLAMERKQALERAMQRVRGEARIEHQAATDKI